MKRTNLKSIAGNRTGPSPGFVFVGIGILAAWLGVILTLGAQGLFQANPGEPPLATLVAFLGPPAAFLFALRSRTLSDQILRIDPVWLTAMQGLRILGAGFLFVHAFGHLPGIFAHTAGWGDVLVALLAPIVAARLAADPAFLKSRWFLGFHLLGLLDFVGALGSGLIARGTIPLRETVESTAALGQLPLLLIPCFAVPLWIILHIIGIHQHFHGRKTMLSVRPWRPDRTVGPDNRKIHESGRGIDRSELCAMVS